LLLVVAVAATVTCLNGGLFGVTGVTYTLAEKGQLPSRFKADLGVTTRGLTISAAIAIIMVNFFDLSTVASLGAATSLMVYALVNVAALRLVDDGGLSRVAIYLSIAACVLAILVWAIYTYQTKPQSLVVFLAFLAISFVAESALQRGAKRRILPQVSESAGKAGDASQAPGA
jgi:amino acid transporter